MKGNIHNIGLKIQDTTNFAPFQNVFITFQSLLRFFIHFVLVLLFYAFKYLRNTFLFFYALEHLIINALSSETRFRRFYYLFLYNSFFNLLVQNCIPSLIFRALCLNLQSQTLSRIPYLLF